MKRTVTRFYVCRNVHITAFAVTNVCSAFKRFLMRLLPLISIPLLWWPLGTSGSPFVARRVEITQLNPDNFPTLTVRGLVFIEYYLPSCPHCIAFAPKWQTFCDDAKIEIPNVLVAQVNCGLYGGMRQQSLPILDLNKHTYF